jgi:hypothetical protein
MIFKKIRHLFFLLLKSIFCYIQQLVCRQCFAVLGSVGRGPAARVFIRKWVINPLYEYIINNYSLSSPALFKSKKARLFDSDTYEWSLQRFGFPVPNREVNTIVSSGRIWEFTNQHSTKHQKKAIFQYEAQPNTMCRLFAKPGCGEIVFWHISLNV